MVRGPGAVGGDAARRSAIGSLPPPCPTTNIPTCPPMSPPTATRPNGATAGMLILAAMALCAALGAAAGALVGAFAPLLIAGVLVGFFVGIWAVYQRFRDV